MKSNNRTNRTQRAFSNLFGLLVCFSMLFTSIAAAPAPKQVQQGTAFPGLNQSSAPAQTVAAPAAQADPSHLNFRQFVIKLKPTAGGIQANAIGGPSIQDTLPAAQIKPLFSEAQPPLPNLTASAAEPVSSYSPRLDLYLQANLDQGTTFADAQKLLEAVQQNPSVDVAYMEPVYLPASSLHDTADLTLEQTYRGDLPGINSDYAFTIRGGEGTGVNLIDIEAGWQIGHEDLNITSSSLLDDSTSATDTDLVNHGTAVLGIIAANDNGLGVLGLAPATTVRMISTFSYTPAEAITKAVSHLSAGDIIVLPIQAFGPLSEDPDLCTPPSPAFGSIPIEYWQANFDAIYAATQKGIIVVEAAGNGAMNLDHARYENKFKLSNRDSGAILVGAGTSGDTHEPLCDSNYGSRVDVQGWGENVATTGYGDLAQGLDADGQPDPNQAYTAEFGGSSAATAMIAGAVASLQGIAKDRGYLLTPYLSRSLLHSTATPQGGIDAATHKIGPLPNLQKAIDTRLTNGVLVVSPLDGAVVYTLRPTLVWQNYLIASKYQVQIAKDSAFRSLVIDTTIYNTEFTPSSNLATGTYYWRVRAMANSVWKPWSGDVPHFQVAGAGAPDVFPVSPASGTLSDNYTPTLTWKLKTAATPIPSGYYIDVSTNYDFSSGTTYQVNDGSTFNYDLPALTHNSRYYWRIRSYVEDGSKLYLGAWSSRIIYYTTLDISAVQQTDLVIDALDGYAETLRPTLDWPDVTDARYYEIQVATSDFTNVILKATVSKPASADTLPSSYRFTTDMPRGKTLYWRVRARGVWGFSAWSPVQSFTAADPPAIPILKTPAIRKVASSWEDGVAFTWLRPVVPVTIPQPDSYEIQAATKNTFDEGLIEGSTSDITSTNLQTITLTGFEPEAVYYWRVRAVSSSGVSNWSGMLYFYTTPPKPLNPKTLAADSLRPTLDWEPVAIARSYQVQVGLDLLFTKGVTTVSTATIPPYDLSFTLPRNTSIYWRVRAGGLYGYGAWSDAVNIDPTPNSPNTPVLKSPATYTILKNFSPTLVWYKSAVVTGNSAASAVGYQVQIFSNPADIAGTTITGLPPVVTESTYVVPADMLTKGDTFYWRVRAVNDGGEYSPWSSIFAFVTPAMVSGKIVDILGTDPAAGLPDILVQLDGRAIQVKTDDKGNYVIRGLTPGNYSITTSPSGYARQTFTFSVGNGSNVIRNFDLVKLPEDDQYRIILSWMRSPFDLDAHLWLPQSITMYHIYKNNTGNIADDAILAEMNFSTTADFGPEVITIGAPRFGGFYQFAVYMNADPKTFINTGARVSVYKGSVLKATYVVPTTGVGHWWKVFRLDGSADKLITQNVITDLNPAPYSDPIP
jgi:serine protease